jgi:hypothetical protein
MTPSAVFRADERDLLAGSLSHGRLTLIESPMHDHLHRFQRNGVGRNSTTLKGGCSPS